MAEAIGERVESFRGSLAGMKPFALAMSAVIGVSSGGGVIARSTDPIGSIPLGALVIVLAAGAGYALMMSLFWLAIRAFPVHVHRGGLRGCNAAGVYTSMPWSEMASVKDVDYLGLEYYQIASSASGRKILVPHFLEDRAGFAARVERLTSFNHALVRALGQKPPAGA